MTRIMRLVGPAVFLSLTCLVQLVGAQESAPPLNARQSAEPPATSSSVEGPKAGDASAQPIEELAAPKPVDASARPAPEKVVLDETAPALPAPPTPLAPTPTPQPVAAGVAPPMDWGLSVADRMLIEEQIDDIAAKRDAKYSLGGPIAVLGVGGAFTIFGLVLTYYGAVFSVTPGDTLDQTGSTMIVAGLGSAVVGAGFAIGGFVWLKGRSAKRRPFNEQIRDLEHQLDFAEVRLTPLVFPTGGGAQVSANFF